MHHYWFPLLCHSLSLVLRSKDYHLSLTPSDTAVSSFPSSFISVLIISASPSSVLAPVPMLASMLLHTLHQNKASLFSLPTYNPMSFITFVFNTLWPRSKDLFRLLTCPWMPKNIRNAVLPQFCFLSSHKAFSNFSCTFTALPWQLNSFLGNHLFMVELLMEGTSKHLCVLYLCPYSPSIMSLMVATSKKELRQNCLLGPFWTSHHKLIFKNKRRN